LKTFVVRKLCEAQFHDIDQPIIYISHSKDIVAFFVMDIWLTLETTPIIIETYGELVDTEVIKKRAKSKQTQTILNLKHRRNTFVPSLIGLSLGSKARGFNCRYALVDDPIDVALEESTAGITKRFIAWLSNKIMPLVKGNLSVVGTRYNVSDLYTQLLETSTAWKQVIRPAIIKWGDYTIHEGDIRPHRIDVSGGWQLLAPELWTFREHNPFYSGSPEQNILYKLCIMGDRAFQQELQNDPKPLNPVIKKEWLIPYSVLPDRPQLFKWVCIVDTASGESQQADYNAYVLMGLFKNKYYIHAILTGRWSPMKRVHMLEQFIQTNCRELDIDVSQVKVRIEAVRTSGNDFYQLLRDDSWIAPIRTSPVGRGNKIHRILNNLAAQMEAGKVYLNDGCDKRDLYNEIDGFPGDHEHVLDATDQGLHYLKGLIITGGGFAGRTTSQFQGGRDETEWD
jgi:phage terminase large subunit-like protein